MCGGFLSPDVEISATLRPVQTRYDIRLAPTPMGRLLSRWGAVETGTTGTLKARAELTGEGDSVRESLAPSDGRIAVIMPAGTFWTRNIERSLAQTAEIQSLMRNTSVVLCLKHTRLQNTHT